MLVLSRKPNETLLIGENIRVVVLDIRGDKVRIGIEAPKDVQVDRSEVRDRDKIVIESKAPQPARRIRNGGRGHGRA